MTAKKAKPMILTALFTTIACLALVALFLRPMVLTVEPVPLEKVADGTYLGFCQNKLLFALVQVQVKDHRLAHIDVLAHKTAYMGQAQAMAGRMVKQNTLAVDAVSGATLTSSTVKVAVANALGKGIP